MRIIRLHPLSGDTKTAAMLDIETDNKITIKGFRLVSGSKGLFLSMPSQKGKDGKYYDTVIFPEDLRRKCEQLAIEEYNRQKESAASVS